MAVTASTFVRQPLARFWGDRRGNFATMAAVLVVPLVTLAGGATDYARSASAKTQVQQALDRAVMEAVKVPEAERQTKGAAAFRAVPLRMVTADTPVFSNNPDGSVSAVTRARVPTAFLSMAGIPNLVLKVEASAGVAAPQAGRCLTTVGSTGAYFGSSTVAASSCRFDLQTATFSGGTVTTSEVCVRSAASNTGGTVPNLKSPCTPTDTAPAAPTMPTAGTCLSAPPATGGGVASVDPADPNKKIYKGGTVVFQPGTYCDEYSFQLGAAVTLNPGTYVLGGGPWSFNGGSLSGDGVSIHFTDGSPLNLNSLTSLTLSAPTAGTRQGVLITDGQPSFLPSSININTRPSSGSLTGLIYSPRRTINLNTAGSNTDRLNIYVAGINVNSATGWRIQPLSTSPSGSGTAGNTPSYLTR